jgi:hypothetical protein
MEAVAAHGMKASSFWGASERGLSPNNRDVALLMNFEMPWWNGERSNIQFRAESFHTFNHPQWKSVNIGCGSETPSGAPCSGNDFNLGNGEVNGAWRLVFCNSG